MDWMIGPLSTILASASLAWHLNRAQADRFAQGPAIVGWANPLMLHEHPGQDLVGRVSDLLCDLCDRKARLLEELTGLFDPQSGEVHPRWYTEAVLEHAREMKC